MVRRRRSYGIRRSKRLPFGRVVYGAKFTPRGKKKMKAYVRYEA